ncbi:MAG: GGDEF domain-containing protein [Saccharospirillaceae bacterium]|nr:GGDEF domain-containing protein [Pseudomonadales bacterium]NRB79272.1 GGDEF domain-containing protein [Saccharospirillaceae bacterium]
MSTQVSTLAIAFNKMGQAKDFLMSHQLIPTPVQYWIAYEYSVAKHPEVVKCIDNYLIEHNDLSPHFVCDLYERCFIPTSDFELTQSVDSLLDNVLQDVSQNGALLDKYAELLNNQVGEIEQSGTTHAVEIINEVVRTTKKTAQSQYELSQRLMHSEQNAKQLQQALKEAQLEAITDQLTGLLNRKGMDKKRPILEIEHNQFTIIMMDIDFFKKINDDNGHLLGDRVIRQFGQVIKNTVRGDDLSIRFGGEEFLIILPSTDINGAVKVAQNIQTKISKIAWKNKKTGATIGPATMSFGIADRCNKDLWDDRIQLADSALYKAKETGRNKIVIHPDKEI